MNLTYTQDSKKNVILINALFSFSDEDKGKDNFVWIYHAVKDKNSAGVKSIMQDIRTNLRCDLNQSYFFFETLDNGDGTGWIKLTFKVQMENMGRYPVYFTGSHERHERTIWSNGWKNYCKWYGQFIEVERSCYSYRTKEAY